MSEYPILGECIAGGQPDTVHWQGQIYHLERVRIEDLPEWQRARGLRGAGHQPRWLATRWPPAILYEQEEPNDRTSTD